MNDNKERLLEILDAAMILGKATLTELCEAMTLCNPGDYEADGDVDDVLAAIDHTVGRYAAREIIDIVGRLRTAQGWATTTEGEQQ